MHPALTYHRSPAQDSTGAAPFIGWLSFACGILSMVCSLVIVVLYIAFPKLRSQWRLYLVFLSIHDFLQGFYYASNWVLEDAFGGINGTATRSNGTNATLAAPPSWCLPQAAIGMYSATASFLWTAGLAIFI